LWYFAGFGGENREKWTQFIYIKCHQKITTSLGFDDRPILPLLLITPIHLYEEEEQLKERHLFLRKEIQIEIFIKNIYSVLF